MALSAHKNQIIRELFVRTADQNYIAARWCAANGLDADFLWLAVHAIEKYQKAVLLINGLSSKGYGHNVVTLFDAVEKIAGALFPPVIERPANLQVGLWFDQSPREFLEHLFNVGNADNRYAINGYNTWPQDLHMLDRMVFLTRRLVVRLDEPLPPGVRGTARSILAGDEKFAPNLHLQVEEIVRSTGSTEDHPLRAVLLNLNLPFAPEDYPHSPMPGRFATSNSALFRHLLHPLESGNHERVSRARALAAWVLENIQLPPDLKKEVSGVIQAQASKNSE